MGMRVSLPTRLLPLWLLAIIFFIPSVEAEIIHVVKPGESLNGIAKKYHIGPAQLQKANSLEGDRIRQGDRLAIPQSSSPSLTARTERSENEAHQELPQVHVVRKGETLAQIARRYHLRQADLKEINELRSRRVRPGQILHLKKMPEEAREIAEGSGPVGSIGDNEISPVLIKGEGFLTEEKDRQLLVRVAKGFLGARYTLGGNSINGMDCSAFVQRVFRVFDIDLPRTAREQFQVGYTVAKEALRVGDLLFFKRSKAPQPTHVGIYIGGGKFIHTSLQRRRVEIGNLESQYFDLRFMGAKRIEESGKTLLREEEETAKPADE